MKKGVKVIQHEFETRLVYEMQVQFLVSCNRTYQKNMASGEKI